MSVIIENFDQDLLSLRPFSEGLLNYIRVEQNFVEDGLVISVNAKYGTGKSTFLRMWKNDLDQRDNKSGLPLMVALNAWESDYYGDPLFAIIDSLLSQMNPESPHRKAIIDAAKDLGWFSTAILSQVTGKFTGIKPVDAGKYARKKKAERNNKTPQKYNGFTQYQDRKEAMQVLRTSLDTLIEEEHHYDESNSKVKSVIFLVDELDRCRPDYAILYLETIKHIFNIPGAVFILAVDRNQLENSARKAFGQDLDFPEYYRKFIHREIQLPRPTDKDYKAIAAYYVPLYLNNDNLRQVIHLEALVSRNLVDLISGLRLSFRQIQEVFRILGHLFEKNPQDPHLMRGGYVLGSLLMVALKVGNEKLYLQIAEGTLTGIQMQQEFDAIIKSSRFRDYCYGLMLTGHAISTENESLEVMAHTLKINVHDFYRLWDEFYDPTEKHPYFHDIYTKIESLEQW